MPTRTFKFVQLMIICFATSGAQRVRRLSLIPLQIIPFRGCIHELSTMLSS